MGIALAAPWHSRRQNLFFPLVVAPAMPAPLSSPFKEVDSPHATHLPCYGGEATGVKIIGWQRDG
jgi:hypothetical protein